MRHSSQTAPSVSQENLVQIGQWYIPVLLELGWWVGVGFSLGAVSNYRTRAHGVLLTQIRRSKIPVIQF